MASPRGQQLSNPLMQAIRTLSICSNPLFDDGNGEIPLTPKEQDVPMGRMLPPGAPAAAPAVFSRVRHNEVCVINNMA